MIGEAVRAGLRRQGFTVDWVTDGVAAAQALASEPYEACVLDLGLARKEGLVVLRELRNRGSTLPVLVLTARDAVTDRVAGLDAGADDYLVKPFDLAELVARLRAITRRHAGRASTTLEYLGVSLEDLKRWEMSGVIHPDDLTSVVERWTHSLTTGAPYQVEFRLRRADGEYRWYLGRALPQLDEAGKVVQWFGTNTDIDDQKSTPKNSN